MMYAGGGYTTYSFISLGQMMEDAADYCRGLAAYNTPETHSPPSDDDYLYGDLQYDPWSEWIDLGGEG